VDSLARTGTQKITVQKKRYRKRQKQYDNRSEKSMQQLTAQKQPGVSIHKKARGCRKAVLATLSNE